MSRMKPFTKIDHNDYIHRDVAVTKETFRHLTSRVCSRNTTLQECKTCRHAKNHWCNLSGLDGTCYELENCKSAMNTANKVLNDM